ncbi:MAG TPA: TetR/AcrR family transcriptional regulator [Solirubrobacteraceae bacterium]|jgi:AcrR family transcriptional regulator
MSRDARLEQLVDVAMPLVAEYGIAGFSLDEVADRAGVTRNLLYHYFPRGREDVMVAVAERAGHELTDGWVTDESIPLDQRIAANFARFLEHSKEPSLAWRVYRLERASSDAELHAIIDRFHEVVIQGVSQNNFGTPDPPLLARMTIKACMVFGETLLDEARESEVPREEVLQVFAQTFRSTMDALRSRLTA